MIKQRTLLQEAAIDRYWQMMQPVYTKVIPSLGLKEVHPVLHEKLMSTENIARELVKFSYELMKKQDRVTWLLVRMRAALIGRLGNIVSTHKGTETRDEDEFLKQSQAQTDAAGKLYDFVAKELQSIVSRGGVADEIRATISSEIEKEISELVIFIEHYMNTRGLGPTNRMITHIEHFFSQNIPRIRSYNIDNVAIPWNQIKEDLWEIEEDYVRKSARFIPMDASDVQPTVLIQYENGSQWLNLNKPWCDLEGRAMGHCGNSGAGSTKRNDRVLSYRTIEKNPVTGQKEWVPHLTFILHEDGQLGEMKGRNNQKPDKKYHGVIVDLLRLPMIEGIVGGGYMPENNFSMNDLPQEVADQLMEEKPALADLKFLYRKYGINDKRTQSEINQIINYHGFPEVAFTNGEDIILNKWKDMNTLVGDIDDDLEIVSSLMNYIMGKDDIESFWHIEPQQEEMEEILEASSPDIRKKIFNYLVDNVDPEIVNDFEETHDTSLDDDGGTLFQFINEFEHQIDEATEIMNTLQMSVETGYRDGVHLQYIEAVEEWMKNLESDGLDINLKMVVQPNEKGKVYLMDNPIILLTTADEFVEVLSNETDYLEYVVELRWLQVFRVKDIPTHSLPDQPEFDLKGAVSVFQDYLYFGGS